MKKLLFVVFLTLGFFTISQAQTFFYNVSNTSGTAWSFKIGDANGNAQYNPPFVGTVGGNWTNFGFQLEFGGKSASCNAYANLTATGSGTIPLVCFTPTFSGWTYSLTQVFGIYFLNVSIT